MKVEVSCESNGLVIDLPCHWPLSVLVYDYYVKVEVSCRSQRARYRPAFALTAVAVIVIIIITWKWRSRVQHSTPGVFCYYCWWFIFSWFGGVGVGWSLFLPVLLSCTLPHAPLKTECGCPEKKVGKGLQLIFVAGRGFLRFFFWFPPSVLCFLGSLYWKCDTILCEIMDLAQYLISHNFGEIHSCGEDMGICWQPKEGYV